MVCPFCHQEISDLNFTCPKCHHPLNLGKVGTGHASEGVFKDEVIRHQDFLSQEDRMMLKDGSGSSSSDDEELGYAPENPSALTSFDRHNEE